MANSNGLYAIFCTVLLNSQAPEDVDRVNRKRRTGRWRALSSYPTTRQTLPKRSSWDLNDRNNDKNAYHFDSKRRMENKVEIDDKVFWVLEETHWTTNSQQRQRRFTLNRPTIRSVHMNFEFKYFLLLSDRRQQSKRQIKLFSFLLLSIHRSQSWRRICRRIWSTASV